MYLGERAVFWQRCDGGDSLGDGLANRRGCERFGEIADDAGTQRQAWVELANARDDHDRGARILFLQPIDQPYAVAPGHAYVDERDVGALSTHRIERAIRIERGIDVEAEGRKTATDDLANTLLVINNEDSGGWGFLAE